MPCSVCPRAGKKLVLKLLQACQRGEVLISHQVVIGLREEGDVLLEGVPERLGSGVLGRLLEASHQVIGRVSQNPSTVDVLLENKVQGFGDAKALDISCS